MRLKASDSNLILVEGRAHRPFLAGQMTAGGGEGQSGILLHWGSGSAGLTEVAARAVSRAPDVAREQASEDGGGDATNRRRR